MQCISHTSPLARPWVIPLGWLSTVVLIVLCSQETALKILVFPLVVLTLQDSLVMRVGTMVVGLESLVLLYKDQGWCSGVVGKAMNLFLDSAHYRCVYRSIISSLCASVLLTHTIRGCRVDKRIPKILSCSSRTLIPDVTWENDSLNVHNPSSNFQNIPKPYICCISGPFPKSSNSAHPRGSLISEMPDPDQFSNWSLFLFFGLGFLTSGTTSCQIPEGSLPECLQQQQTIYTHPGPIMPKMSQGILLQLGENETRSSVWWKLRLETSIKIEVINASET